MICPYCRADVEDLGRHYAHNPPRGCPQVALAFDRDYWPFKERDEPSPLPDSVKPIKRGYHAPGMLKVKDGVKLCRCGRGPVVYRWKCRPCNNAYNRARRAQQRELVTARAG